MELLNHASRLGGIWRSRSGEAGFFVVAQDDPNLGDRHSGGRERGAKTPPERAARVFGTSARAALTPKSTVKS
jgi:hypothetical protein